MIGLPQKMFNVYFNVYLRKCTHICIDFFFFGIWIGNESEDLVPPDLVRIRQSSRVGYEAAIGFLQRL